jgi:hypothetical protein
MVALRKPPDLPVKKNLNWQEGFAQVAAGFARTFGLGQKEEQGYYAKHRRQYVKHIEVQRLVAATECEKVHALKVRSKLAWAASTLGVVTLGFSMFALVAIAKGDAKFQKEVVVPVREYLRKTTGS